MRLERSSVDAKHGVGKVSLIPEEPEDMWHAYNLIQPYDRLQAKAVRKVKSEHDTGSVKSKSVVMELTISVINTDFDIGSGQLHVSGRVAVENNYVKIGSHHTLDLELHRRFILTKGEDEKGGLWDSIALEMLREACETERKAELWAIVMGEGIANICLITEHQTILRQRIEVAVPRKRRGGIDGHDKGMEKFFSTTLSTLLRHMEGAKTNASNPEKTVPLLIASPGFVAQSFLQYIKGEATRTMNKQLMSIIPSALVAHSSSHHVHALKEVLASSAIMSQLSDTKFAKETALMDKLTTLIRLDDGRAWYGPREVERAVEKGAVGRGGGVLLLSNALFRAQDVSERKRWVRLVDRVRDVEGGEVRVLSSLHESGKRLESLGNIAAILTFPLQDLDIDDDEEGGGRGDVAAEDMII